VNKLKDILIKTMKPPEKILIPSDENVIELVQISKTELQYKFIKSETKKGLLMTMSEEQLKINLRKKIMTEL